MPEESGWGGGAGVGGPWGEGSKGVTQDLRADGGESGVRTDV